MLILLCCLLISQSLAQCLLWPVLTDVFVAAVCSPTVLAATQQLQSPPQAGLQSVCSSRCCPTAAGGSAAGSPASCCPGCCRGRSSSHHQILHRVTARQGGLRGGCCTELNRGSEDILPAMLRFIYNHKHTYNNQPYIDYCYCCNVSDSHQSLRRTSLE